MLGYESNSYKGEFDDQRVSYISQIHGSCGLMNKKYRVRKIHARTNLMSEIHASGNFMMEWYHMSQIHARGDPVMKGCAIKVKFT